ncbi:MAG: hypothetical protein ACREFC_01760, partial [Stellaceae bacterium]
MAPFRRWGIADEQNREFFRIERHGKHGLKVAHPRPGAKTSNPQIFCDLKSYHGKNMLFALRHAS